MNRQSSLCTETSVHFNRTSFGGGYVICGQCCFQNMSLDVDDLLKEIADLEDSDDAEQEPRAVAAEASERAQASETASSSSTSTRERAHSGPRPELPDRLEPEVRQQEAVAVAKGCPSTQKQGGLQAQAEQAKFESSDVPIPPSTATAAAMVSPSSDTSSTSSKTSDEPDASSEPTRVICVSPRGAGDAPGTVVATEHDLENDEVSEVSRFSEADSDQAALLKSQENAEQLQSKLETAEKQVEEYKRRATEVGHDHDSLLSKLMEFEEQAEQRQRSQAKELREARQRQEADVEERLSLQKELQECQTGQVRMQSLHRELQTVQRNFSSEESAQEATCSRLVLAEEALQRQEKSLAQLRFELQAERDHAVTTLASNAHRQRGHTPMPTCRKLSTSWGRQESRQSYRMQETEETENVGVLPQKHFDKRCYEEDATPRAAGKVTAAIQLELDHLEVSFKHRRIVCRGAAPVRVHLHRFDRNILGARRTLISETLAEARFIAHARCDGGAWLDE
eukprot:s3023_g16.t4